jgi:alpha-tubulin suppressor-like RCC1 family protein
MGTGGNRFGPLGAHGLGEKAERWGRVFEGARAIATGSRHSVAIRIDGTLWAWGQGFGMEPRRLLEDFVAVAAGDAATIALGADGSLWQWDGGAVPRRLRVL